MVQGGFVFFDDFLFDVLGADDGYFFAEGHEKVVDPVGFGQCQVNGVSVLCLGDGVVFQLVIQFEADFRGNCNSRLIKGLVSWGWEKLFWSVSGVGVKMCFG